MNITKEDIQKAVEQMFIEACEKYPNTKAYLDLCDTHYHTAGIDPIIPDTLYDTLKERFINHQIGARSESNTVRHRCPIYSMDKVYLHKPEKAIKKINMANGIFYQTESILDYKIDGVPLSFEYEHGELQRILTRGDGKFGKDVTPVAIRFMQYNVPYNIPDKSKITVRGEAVIAREVDKGGVPISDFNHPVYVSRRHMLSACLMADDYDHRDGAVKHIDFYPYDLLGDEGYNDRENWDNLFQILLDWKFEFNDNLRAYLYSCNHSGVLSEVDMMLNTLEQLPYDADGICLKINSMEVREKMGYTQHHPKYQVAFKPSPPAAKTEVMDIVWQRRNRITANILPVIKVKPTTIDRHVINKVNGYNLTTLLVHRTNIGDKIEICLPGGTTPQIHKYVAQNKLMDHSLIPTRCPRCKGPVKYREPHMICINHCK
ncbi:MAG: hypothetical protein GY804_09250 [Alphaproteobacteria bacterium]|nr:hypothetical protein [Alphaproteobacteria bacterium]